MSIIVVSVDQFGGIVGNITACSNLWFSEDELPEAGKHHNLALHISMNCKTDMLSNVLVDTGLSSRFSGVKSLIRFEPFNH